MSFTSWSVTSLLRCSTYPVSGRRSPAKCSSASATNADRLKSEAAFAHLCGAAPIPASSGRTHRHRLNRGGDRSANNALYVVVLGRMRHDARTRAYVERRTHEGLAKPEIIRCLKRYVAREIYNTLKLATPTKKPEQLLATP